MLNATELITQRRMGDEVVRRRIRQEKASPSISQEQLTNSQLQFGQLLDTWLAAKLSSPFTGRIHRPN